MINNTSKKICGIYFANHFYNFYHEAPTEKIYKYLDDLKSDGENSACLWFDMHHYSGIDNEDARYMLDKMKYIYEYARKIGMKTALLVLANEYYKTSPKELRAENSTESGLYHQKLSGYYYTEICPSQAKGKELILKSKEDLWKLFSPMLDYIIIWPYDQGGCTCKKCFPWGANGFYNLAKQEAELARKVIPNVKIVFSTWYFDHFTSGEWDGFFANVNRDGVWFDALMVNIFAELPLRVESLGVPIISFPEISMRGTVPWGGFGANPYPVAIKEALENVKDTIDGGFAYSEGIFEDINKAVVLALYDNPNEDIKSIVTRYAAKYYGGNVCEDACRLIIGLEDTLNRNLFDKNGNSLPAYPEKPFAEIPRFVIDNPKTVKELYELAVSIDSKLTEKAKKSWRWRIVYLRAAGDYALMQNDWYPSDKTDAIYKELEKIYYAENAHYFLAPVTKASVLRERMNFV